jgi:hypothetical protein
LLHRIAVDRAGRPFSGTGSTDVRPRTSTPHRRGQDGKGSAEARRAVCGPGQVDDKQADAAVLPAWSPERALRRPTGYRHSWRCRRGMLTGYAPDCVGQRPGSTSNEISITRDQPGIFSSLRSSVARIWLSHSVPSWRPLGSWSPRSQRHVVIIASTRIRHSRSKPRLTPG